jgi:hypothetical protein
MKILSYIWTQYIQYIFAFFTAIFLCLIDLIVDGVAAGSAKFWSYTILVFIALSAYDLIKFIISKVKN